MGDVAPVQENTLSCLLDEMCHVLGRRQVHIVLETLVHVLGGASIDTASWREDARQVHDDPSISTVLLRLGEKEVHLTPQLK